MGSIKTIKDASSDLTANTVKGKITYEDFVRWITDYYSGSVTKFVLWDFSEADLSDITTQEFDIIAEMVKTKSNLRKGGKSAFVHSTDVGFGLGRMFEAFSEVKGTEFEFKTFRSIAEAKKWFAI